MLFGGIEAGGTKWVLATGTGPDDLRTHATIPTTGPDETLARVAEFFAGSGIDALGVGSFGPVDLATGTITTTPKPGWAGTRLVERLEALVAVPVALDTDVNAAALGELRWGAARGLDTFVYLTIGTGIGGGVVAHGRPVHGLSHPELGHMRIPHDRVRDPFAGCCPYHGDCFEGLASGTALAARGGEDWELEAEYIALGVTNAVACISPQRVILGGGVMKTPGLLARVGARVTELAAGYVPEPDVVAPGLGDYAGVLGALELARSSSTRSAIESTISDGR
jgi:fructokinase